MDELDGDLNLEAVFAAVDIPTIVLDATGSILVWNEAEAELTGISKSEVEGLHPIGEYFYEGDRDQILAEKVLEHPQDAHEVYDVEIADEDYSLLQSGDAPTFEDTSTATAGTGAKLWFIATPLYDDGDLIGVVEFVQRRGDSERRRREMDRLLDELTDTLNAFEEGDFGARAEFDYAETVVESDERKVLEKVNDLARMRQALQEQVVEATEAKRDLERQNEKLEKFAEMVSHDLRNPLNVAMGSVDMALETGETDHMRTAMESLERMEEMIGEMLTYARGGGDLSHTETVTVGDVASDAWGNVFTEEATITVETGDLEIQAHREGLLSIFENLYRNAVEHNDSPLTIRVATTEPVDGTRTIFVADSGTGLPTDIETAKLFEHGVTRSEDGTGFGLSIVEDIVDAHGWEITAGESTDGGARFDVHVPV